MRKIFLILFMSTLYGCASHTYRDTGLGRFRGVVDVRWVKSDYFQFLPRFDEPFEFIRPNGTIIRPGSMLTDGGSIPRFLWGIKGYSPWGYAPAYIVHDWLFEAQHCGYEPDNKYTFSDSVTILAEGLKVIMETDPAARDYFVFDTVIAAVGTPIAHRLWNGGVCKSLTRRFQKLDEQPLGDLIMTIRFK
ncbi:DUF1353 domain-containing protein [Gammaproteobacteria bacterium]